MMHRFGDMSTLHPGLFKSFKCLSTYLALRYDPYKSVSVQVDQSSVQTCTEALDSIVHLLVQPHGFL